MLEETNREQRLNEDEIAINNMADLSGQGLTTVPATLWNRSEIQTLVLSSNNIRSIPGDISKLKLLVKLELSRNGFKCLNPRDYSSLPKELEQLTCLKELSISECGLVCIPNTIWRLKSVEHLDISRNKIGKLSGDIKGLQNLTFLNCQQTGITCFPEDLCLCEKLETLLAFGNLIDNLPDNLPNLISLKKISLNLRYFCSQLDNYVKAMLEKNQIHSEHIPLVLFDLPNLQELDVGECKLNYFPDYLTTSLTWLSFAENYFTEIPMSVLLLKNLVVLDCSNNKIQIIPELITNLRHLRKLIANNNLITKLTPKLCTLSKLEYLDLGKNQITELPADILHLKSLKTLILHDNLIAELPTSLCNMQQLETLDLTANKLRGLPVQMYNLTNITSAHAFSGLFKRGLWLFKNEIQNPPETIWKRKDTKAMWNYLRQMEIKSIKDLQTLKCTFIGNSKCGKSCLIQSILHKKPISSDCMPEETKVFDTYRWKSDNGVKFMFLELGGNQWYQTFYPKLINNQGLSVIVFDLVQYKEQGFDITIGKWLQLINCYAPKALVVLVGTKFDLYFQTINFMQNVTAKYDLKQVTNPINKTSLKTQPDNFNLGVKTTVLTEEDEKVINADADSITLSNDIAVISQILHIADADNNGNKNKDATEILKNFHDVDIDNVTDKDATEILQNLHDIDIDSDIIKDNDVAKTLSTINEEIINKIKNDILTQITNEIALYDTKLSISTRCFITYSSEACNFDDNASVSDFCAHLETLAIDKNYFPGNQRKIPEVWPIFLALIHKRFHLETHLYFEQLLEIASTNFEMDKNMLENFLDFYNSTGQLFWIKQSSNSRQVIFHRPTILKNILNAIFRVNLEDSLDFDLNRMFNYRGNLTRNDFLQCKFNFLNYGEISQKLLHCFLFDMAGKNATLLNNVLTILTCLGLGYDIISDSIPTKESLNNPCVVVIQHIRSSIELAELKQLKEFINNTGNISSFKRSFCNEIHGLWEFLSVELHWQITERIDWCNAIYAKNCDLFELILWRREDVQHKTYSYYMELKMSDSNMVHNILTWFDDKMSEFLMFIPNLLPLTNCQIIT